MADSVGLSAAQKLELWKRRKRGESLTAIGRVLGRTASTIYTIVSAEGGICPAPRRRSKRALTLNEREEISRGIAAGDSIRQIARELGRAPSTVSREIGRHEGCHRYRAARADRQAWDWARRPKPCRLAGHARLRDLVATKLSLNWSPQQISGWLKTELADQPDMQISPETIYRSLFIQARGVLKKELVKHLRSRRPMRRPQSASNKGQARGRIVDAVSIRERPAEVEDRALPGHWEGDLLSGAHNHSHIATLVERQSRYVMLVKVADKTTASVVSALTQQVQKLPQQLRASLTWDRGLEMANHKQFTLDTKLQVYFCDPQSPWQRGTNENTNGLLRQYFPKGTVLSRYSQAELDAVALELNQRPRKTLGYRTPEDKLRQVLR